MFPEEEEWSGSGWTLAWKVNANLTKVTVLDVIERGFIDWYFIDDFYDLSFCLLK